ncbi:MAG TPA: DNA-formamidopyrimidine glycosylase family protein [Gaiellaceae bacterium]|nr:DNA-formamidopyrimidine glycosylase family protein [Gaiellaceae bacterium]
MPEGDSLHRAARELQVLVGEIVEVETPHPRAAVKGLAERLDGRRLEQVEAVGKNLLLHFEGGLVLRSHLRMNGRWRVEPRGTARTGKPWLVLRGAEHEAVLWNGSVLELVGVRGAPRLGPDILGEPPDFETMLARLRSDPRREAGDALLDQRLVAGIGNIWRAEALWEARISPWRRLEDVDDEALRAVLEAAHALMQASVDGGRPPRRVYRRAGRACPRCGGIVRSAPQGENARTAYWCPGCQVGGNAPPS